MANFLLVKILNLPNPHKSKWSGASPGRADGLEDLIQASRDANGGLPAAGFKAADSLEARQVPEGSDLDANEKHAALLEKVIRYGLNQSQYLIDVQVNKSLKELLGQEIEKNKNF